MIHIYLMIIVPFISIKGTVVFILPLVINGKASLTRVMSTFAEGTICKSIYWKAAYELTSISRNTRGSLENTMNRVEISLIPIVERENGTNNKIGQLYLVLINVDYINTENIILQNIFWVHVQQERR